VIDLQWLSECLCDVLRAHLANPGQDDGPEVPIAGQRVWSIFLELNTARSGGMGPNPIATGDVEAWSRIRREPVRPFEVTMLRALDAVFMEAARVVLRRGVRALVIIFAWCF
jgi:hypothetical protein